MKNKPKRIFLVVGNEEPQVKDFKDLNHEFVCWCEDRINKTDIEYKLVKPIKKEDETQEELWNKVFETIDKYRLTSDMRSLNKILEEKFKITRI